MPPDHNVIIGSSHYYSHCMQSACECSSPTPSDRPSKILLQSQMNPRRLPCNVDSSSSISRRLLERGHTCNFFSQLIRDGISVGWLLLTALHLAHSASTFCCMIVEAKVESKFPASGDCQLTSIYRISSTVNSILFRIWKLKKLIFKLAPTHHLICFVQ